MTKNSSRSSSSSAGLVHKPQVSTLSSAYDPLEFQLGQQHPPIDAITGVVSQLKNYPCCLNKIFLDTCIVYHKSINALKKLCVNQFHHKKSEKIVKIGYVIINAILLFFE